jgi:hypothetical protein
MSKPVLDFQAIRRVTSRLGPAEADLTDAIASNAELLASILRAQRAMSVSPEVTHALIAELSAANGELVSGMGRTVEAHRLLAGLRDDLGIRVVSYGGGMWKGEELPALSGSAEDSRAADAA